ncbi:MAG TPA: NAD(P)/FAD-dependent oxidoreductase [Flavitalea sp.]|nr:NAD(P)/FAD-dependent oxidoreductase [Flavitalea sp.]
MSRQHVIIIGAGASGLIAGSEIAEKFDVTLVETNHQTGGRIRTFPAGSGDGIIEHGAEFVHGETPITTKLVKDAGLELLKLDGKMLRKQDKQWIEEEDMIEGWDDLLHKMKGQRSDMTMDQFIQKHFADDKFAELRRHIRAFVQGFDVADTSEISLQSLYREWSNESDQFRIKTGYGSLIQFLEKKCIQSGCGIYTGETAKQIDWKKNEVTVYTSSGKKFSGNKVLITVPVSILKDLQGKASINFIPPVDDYISAARDIGFGTVIKVVLELKEKIWPDKTGFIFSDEMFPTWWTQYPVDNNLITGWVGGPGASGLRHYTDQELLNIATDALAHIFDLSPSGIRKIISYSFVFNWGKYDESSGAYSFSTPDSVSARKLLNTPLDHTVYFAGEALYEGEYSGTVEAAFNSGLNAAKVLLKSI